jgi:G3E family GTPase
MGIEAPLMTDDKGEVLEDFYELPNGCICCTVKDDLVSTLELLIEKKKELEYIMVESNGLADPAEIIKIFWIDDALQSSISLNFTMGIVDAKNFDQNLKSEDTGEALRRQLVYSDKVMINKIDLVDEATIESIKTTIRDLNPNCQIE